MDEIIKILMSMGKTKEEALEFVGKEMPKGGVDNVASNVLKPITRKVAGDFPLIGSRITDPTQTGQFGKYNLQALGATDRYSLIRQSTEYIGFEEQNETIQALLDEITELREENLEIRKQNLNLIQDFSTGVTATERTQIGTGANIAGIRTTSAITSGGNLTSGGGGGGY